MQNVSWNPQCFQVSLQMLTTLYTELFWIDYSGSRFNGIKIIFFYIRLSSSRIKARSKQQQQQQQQQQLINK